MPPSYTVKKLEVVGVSTTQCCGAPCQRGAVNCNLDHRFQCIFALVTIVLSQTTFWERTFSIKNFTISGVHSTFAAIAIVFWLICCYPGILFACERPEKLKHCELLKIALRTFACGEWTSATEFIDRIDFRFCILPPSILHAPIS